MKLARFRYNDQVLVGAIQGDQISTITGDMFGELATGDPICTLDEVKLLPPTVPHSIVAVGINYPARVEQHYALASEQERFTGPVLFLMPVSSLIGHEEAIRFPALAQEIGAAGELVVVMKRRTRNIAPHQVSEHILGYTCGNDLSSLDLFRADSGQTLRAHGFDCATVMGPFIQTDVSPDKLAITLRINGAVASHGNSGDMIYPVEEIVSYISQFMTLFPGDTIYMGTPMGAPVHIGDMVEIEVEGIGKLRNEVVESE